MHNFNFYCVLLFVSYKFITFALGKTNIELKCQFCT